MRIWLSAGQNKKLNAEVYLNDTVGKDKDDNVVTLEEVLENEDKSVEDVVDLKLKIKNLKHGKKIAVFSFINKK